MVHERLAIIADDFTGAADTAVHFARRGLDTAVWFEPWDAADLDALEVVAVDTGSRGLPPAAAYARVKHAAARLVAAGYAPIYKKVDSTLRGNLGAEIDALMDAAPYALAAVAPAVPRQGRTTSAGRHYLRGVPIEQTEIGVDPHAPVTRSDLLALLAAQSRRRAALLPLAVLRGDEQAFRRHLRGLPGVELLVCDAETDADLGRIARRLAALDEPVLFVGAAGLAAQLPAALGLPDEARAPPAPPPSERPALLVAGSRSATTRAQIARLARLPNVAAVALDPRQLDEAARRQAEAERCARALLAALDRGSDVALFAAAVDEPMVAPLPGDDPHPLPAAELAACVAETLGAVAAQAARRHDLQGLILTGGETALAVCRRLGARGYRLHGEVEPGVPIGQLAGAGDLWAVTKAGAFGAPGTLVHALRVLKAAPTPRPAGTRHAR